MDKIAFVGDVHLSDSPPKIRKDVDYLGTLLNKLEYVYNSNNVVFFLGDLFKTAVVSHSALCRVISFFQKYVGTKETYCIIGNHDVPYLNKDLLYRTSLGVLDIIGLIKVVKDSITLFGQEIKVIPFKNVIECPNNMDILVGHCFFESELDPEYSLSRDMISDVRCKYVILGHDHSPYPEMNINNLKIIRNGSLCRDNSNSYNFDEFNNRVSYYEIIVDNNEIKSGKKKSIPVLPPREVFVDDAFLPVNHGRNKFSYLFDIGALLDKYEKKPCELGKETDETKEISTVLSVMREMKVPEEIVSYIRSAYTSVGMVLK